MTSPKLKVEDLPDGVRVLTLDNPSRRNAVDEELLSALKDAVAPDATGHVRAFLVRGANGAFCSGYDLGALPEAPDEGHLPDDELGRVLLALSSHRAPSVALVEGPAFGAGCELASSCDFRVAAESAVFSMPPAKLGIVYAPEGLNRLIALVGLSRAKRMFLTGMKVDSRTAHAWGLADEVAPAADADHAALRLCTELARNAPLAVAGMKRAFTLLSRVQLSAEDVQELRELRRAAFQSEDAKEGRAAFLEKRAPVFRGR